MGGWRVCKVEFAGRGMREIRISLPFPPSTNTYWRSVAVKGSGRVKVLISEKGREYRSEVISEIMKFDNDLNLSGRLHVELKLCPPDKRRRDIDNFSKAILDALTHAGLWLDDSQIDKMTVTRGEVDKEFPRAYISVTEV